MFKTYMRLLGFARPIKKYAIPYGIYSLLYALFNSLTFMLIIPILNTMFDDGFSPEYVEKLPPVELNQEYLTTLFNYTYSHLFDTYDRQNVLLLLAAVAIIISFLSNLFRYLGSWTIENMRTRTLQKMRNEMFSRVMDMNVGYFSDQRKGDIISKITSDVGVVQFCITNTLQVSFREPFLIVGYIVMMIAISWELAIFSVLFLPLVALLIGNIVKRLRHPARTNQKRMGEMVSTLDESLSGIKVIKSYNATEYIKQKYYDISADLARLTLSMARRQQLASPMSEFLGITAVGVILVFGGALVSRGALDPGGFIAFVAIFSQITRPVRTFIDQFANINQGIAAGERIFSIIDTKPEIEDKPDARELKGLRDKIEFRHVHFSYDGTREVIDDISFEIRRGQTVALVGPSGGGKSTLSELLPRFYDPTSGEILIDGISLRDYTQDSVRAHMSVVAQDTVLFNDTIEGNIAMGRPSATHEEIVEAAKVANADSFIRECPEGYGTNIGDRGVKLSGGQRQRLSIARAVLKNPDILILDEATSALDTESEKLVQDALNNLLKGRTSVVIAHRLSTIHNADKIIVVDHGRIAEQGTHAELMARNGIYAKLIEMQSFD
ncbi:ABC transporter ATP-binding protein [uncultured Alistipes sp.]|jgi:subfamily B ATP-binding cassette protein MsbA|uniref:ABC transporter ATP-binding protein n=1 Tax=uncultured Alistipes sp. TaxID=538949 RepID=UPI000E864AE7|nr:ABC transporter ATP-binding protein [uncultured Alistipes sp.]HBL70961.1 antibiotic ABC transporter ATP-binding protein [Alistipes sp.]HBW01690.1 antibiotic ABC transporter ATP-binding protein [Alistipes sp.]